MSVRAVADQKFIRKYIYLSLAGLAFCLWGVYDAVYKFPTELQMAEAFDQIKDEPDAIERWTELAKGNLDRGWELEKPHNSAETVRGYMRFNNFIIIGGLGLMSFFLLKFFRTQGSYLESTETGIQTSWGKSLEFNRITKINKRRWASKGIAKVAYQDANGKRRTMVFDDFKYQREPMAELMTMCEQGLQPDQIVGGKSQAKIAAEAAAKAAKDQPEPLSS